MNISEVKFDCIHFRTSIPCVPNKKDGSICRTCSHYAPISKRILIIKLGALGDVVRTTPLLRKYREIYPNCHITWITSSPEILPKSEINIIYNFNAKSIFVVSNSSFDIAVCLDKEPEATMLLAKVEAKEKYGYSFKNNQIVAATIAAEHKLMTGFFDQLSQKNKLSYVQEVFDICHLPFNMEEYVLTFDESLKQKHAANLKKLAAGKPIIALNTGCGPRWNTRLWSDDYWKELAQNLKKNGYFPIFVGGSLEHTRNFEMAKETDSTYLGQFELQEFIALLACTNAMITQVTMAMHLAMGLQKPLVLMNTIFNRNEFELYGRGEIIEPSEPCQCYFGNTCARGVNCMLDIKPAQILEAVYRLKL